MKINICLFVIISALCFNCSKDENQNRPRVIDALTKTPIPDVRVTLVSHDPENPDIQPEGIVLEVVHTNETGYYHLGYPIRDSVDWYYVYAVADGYADRSERQRYPSQEDFELTPEGYLKIRLLGNDTIGYTAGRVRGNGDYYFSGFAIDTTFIDAQPAGNSGSVKFWLRQDGEFQRYDEEESIFIPPRDTVCYEILF